MLKQIVLITALFALPAFAGRAQTGFLNRTVMEAGEEYRYQVYVPADWNDHKKWPVILFLHGSGERGNDGVKQTLVGIGPVLRNHPERVPAIVVMPQWFLQANGSPEALASGTPTCCVWDQRFA